MVVAPLSLRGLAAPALRLRAGLVGTSKDSGTTSSGESAVFEGLREATVVRGLAAVRLACLVAGIEFRSVFEFALNQALYSIDNALKIQLLGAFSRATA